MLELAERDLKVAITNSQVSNCKHSWENKTEEYKKITRNYKEKSNENFRTEIYND